MRNLLLALGGLLFVGCGTNSLPGFPAHSVAFSADGKYLTSGCQDGYLHVWDAVTLRRVTSLKVGVGAPVKLVAFAPGGELLASVSEPDEAGVRLWNLIEGKPTARGALQPTEAERTAIFSLAFSPNGKLLALGTLGGVQLWDVGDQPFRKQHRFDEGEVLSVAFDSSSQRLAVSGGPRVRIWDVSGQQPEKQATLEADRASIGSVAFSPDGKLLASGEGVIEDGMLRVWSLSGKTPKEQSAVQVAPVVTQAHVYSVAFAPDGNSLATAHAGCIRLWDFGGDGLKQRIVLAGETKGTVKAVAFAPDGKRIAAAVDNLGIKVWDLSGPTPQERDWLK